MAKVQMMMPEDFLVKLSSLGKKSDEICEKVLEAGGEIVLEKTKSNLASVIGSGTKYDSAPRVNWNAPWGCPLSGWTKTATTT